MFLYSGDFQSLKNILKNFKKSIDILRSMRYNQDNKRETAQRVDKFGDLHTLHRPQNKRVLHKQL